METRQMPKHTIEIEDRETGDAIVRAIIEKAVSFINPEYCVVQEGKETYHLFRCVDMRKYIRQKRLFSPEFQKTLEEKLSALIRPPFMVADEENKTYFVFRPIPHN